MGFIIFLVIVGGIIIAVKSSSNNSKNTSKTESSNGMNYTVIDDTPYQPQQRPEVIYDKSVLKCEPGKGLIGYFHLEDWFNQTFSDEEILYMKEKLAKTMMNPDQLNKTVLSSTTQTVQEFLGSMAYNFNTKKDIKIAIKFMDKAAEFTDLSGMSAMDLHYYYMNPIEIYYKDRENPESLEKAIMYCKKMIEIAPEAFKEIKEYNANLYTEEDKKTLPKELIKSALANPPHKGFEQLATIEYKRGNYVEVINLCKQAKKLKFSGGWDSMIEKAQKKIDEQNNKIKKA